MYQSGFHVFINHFHHLITYHQKLVGEVWDIWFLIFAYDVDDDDDYDDDDGDDNDDDDDKQWMFTLLSKVSINRPGEGGEL